MLHQELQQLGLSRYVSCADHLSDLYHTFGWLGWLSMSRASDSTGAIHTQLCGGMLQAQPASSCGLLQQVEGGFSCLHQACSRWSKEHRTVCAICSCSHATSASRLCRHLKTQKEPLAALRAVSLGSVLLALGHLGPHGGGDPICRGIVSTLHLG